MRLGCLFSWCGWCSSLSWSLCVNKIVNISFLHCHWVTLLLEHQFELNVLFSVLLDEITFTEQFWRNTGKYFILWRIKELTRPVTLVTWGASRRFDVCADHCAPPAAQRLSTQRRVIDGVTSFPFITQLFISEWIFPRRILRTKLVQFKSFTLLCDTFTLAVFDNHLLRGIRTLFCNL